MSMPEPTLADLTKVRELTEHIAFLKSELDKAEWLLVEEWKKVPFDSDVLKPPFKSAIAINCISCGSLTRWRTGRGIAKHIECPINPRGVKGGKNIIPLRRRQVNDAVWKVLFDEEDE